MKDAKEQILRERGFEFFGAITASLSHEINNVFAIVNELSGLLDDFFKAAEQGAQLKVDRLQSTTKRIAAQVDRGKDHIKRLNGFAHTVDEQQVSIELNETVGAISALCRRFGVLRRVEIETNLPEQSPKIVGSQFDLQHIIYRCIDIALNVSEQGDTLKIDVEAQTDGARIVFSNSSAVESVAELESKTELLAVLLAEIHGTFESVLQVGRALELKVFLPGSQNSRGKDHER